MESLHDSTGLLDYQLAGAVDRQERPLLQLRVGGVVQLQCQRCLEGFDHPLDIDTAVRLVAAEALESEYDDDPDEPDCVAASSEFDVTSLIEDEVLLALPTYPRHEAGRCTGRTGSAEAAGAKILAFSALQALKQKVIQSKE